MIFFKKVFENFLFEDIYACVNISIDVRFFPEFILEKDAYSSPANKDNNIMTTIIIMLNLPVIVLRKSKANVFRNEPTFLLFTGITHQRKKVLF